MKNIRLILIVCLIGLWNKSFSQNSPFSVNNPSGQSVTQLTSGVHYGSFMGFQRFNSSVNYYAFETGAGSFDDFRLHVNNGWSTPIMAFKPDGSVGIGTASPSYKLDVSGPIRGNTMILNQSSGNAQLYFMNAGNSDWDLGTQVGEATQNFNLYNRGTSTIALSINKASNNVGIGTTTPDYKLHIKDGVGGAQLKFQRGTGLATIVQDNNVNNLYVDASSGLFLNSQTGGNVGIGTTTPDYKLHIKDGVGGAQLKFQRGTGLATIVQDNNVNNLYLDASSGLLLNSLNGGNVGIGITSPTDKLHIDGDIRLKGTSRKLIVGSEGSPSDYLLLQDVGSGTGAFQWVQDGSTKFTIEGVTGNVGIGLGTVLPDAKLSVKGQVHAQEVKVDLNGAVAPDYVFEKDYKLTALEEIKNYIDQNKHLPEVPSAKEMEKDGVQLGEMNMLLLKKIEELTLYVIEQNKKDQNQQQQIEKLLVEVEKLKSSK